MIYLVTPTGNRQAGIVYLARYINAQDYLGEMKWVIVDDCEPRTMVPRVNAHVDVIRPPWVWDGENTQSACLNVALEHVPQGATVLILEDDDAYLPGHVSNVVDTLKHNELVGERDSRYYNVLTRRHRTLRGTYHASLASVGVRGNGLVALQAACRGGKTGIDVRLWRGFKGTKCLMDTHNVIGIKGMPGRGGIGVGHRASFGIPDTTGMLKAWLGPRLAGTYTKFGTVV